MSLTDVRLGLQGYLTTALSVRMVAGVIEGPAADEDIGCVWVTGGQSAGDAESEIVTVHVRLFRRFSPDTPELRDPAALEADVDKVKTALKATQAGLAGAWFFLVNEWELDLETNGTEYVVTCWRTDPFAAGG